MVRQPGHRSSRACAAHRGARPGHRGEPARPAARAAPVRRDQPAPRRVPAGGGVRGGAHYQRDRRPVRVHRHRGVGDPVRVALSAVLARPGRGVDRPDARADRDQPAAGQDQPPDLAGRALAGLRELAGRLRAQHRLGPRPVARRTSRPGHRLRRRGGRGGGLAGHRDGPRDPAGAPRGAATSRSCSGPRCGGHRARPRISPRSR